jgi:hypothetical protein
MTKGDDAGVSGESGYAEVKGLEMYYEIHGTGTGRWFCCMALFRQSAPRSETFCRSLPRPGGS